MDKSWLIGIIVTLVWIGLPVTFALGAKWGYGNGYRHGHEVGFLMRHLKDSPRRDQPRPKAGRT